jgi:hypothetical protein
LVDVDDRQDCSNPLSLGRRLPFLVDGAERGWRGNNILGLDLVQVCVLFVSCSFFLLMDLAYCRRYDPLDLICRKLGFGRARSGF